MPNPPRADRQRDIRCFNLAAMLSFGVPVGDVPSSPDQPRLISAIARDLFVEGVDVAAHKRYIETPPSVPDRAPYQRAIREG